MQWLTQNWLWIVLGLGFLFLMTRRGGMGGCGMGHSSHRDSDRDIKSGPPANDQSSTPMDPVTGRAVQSGNPRFSTVYRGRAYYFETRENRDAFEAQPDKFLAGSPGLGQPIETEDPYRDRPRRRHGC